MIERRAAQAELLGLFAVVMHVVLNIVRFVSIWAEENTREEKSK